MWRATLSRPLPVVALVGRYPTNKLIGHEPLPDRRSFARWIMRSCGVIGYYRHFRKGPKSAAMPESRVRYPCIPRPFATLLATEVTFAFDLHVLAMPPAFALSQDQTLQLFVCRRVTRNTERHAYGLD